jgi:hypothetical protein
MSFQALPVGARPAGTTGRFLFLAIAVLSLAGAIVSGVSLERHYAKSATSFCDLGEKFNCDIVNRSEQSEVMGIPVAAIGVVGYGVLFALSTFYRGRAQTPLRLWIAAIAGASHLCRSLRFDDLVRLVFDFAGADFSDQRAGWDRQVAGGENFVMRG